MSTPKAPVSSSNVVTEQDRDCAVFARQALFPQQMHRDWKNTGQFPALTALDRLRHRLMQQHQSVYQQHPSALFPRGVILVRDLQDESRLQWNGTPDIDPADASFAVIPRQLTVRCTSDCARLTNFRQQTALLVQQHSESNDSNSTEAEETTLILCTDRLLQSDYREPLEASGVARELPRKSYKAIEEAVAHQIAKLGIAMQMDKDATLADAAAVTEIEAAKAAECYYSRHTYDAKNAVTQQVQIQRGSGLPAGYSKLPTFLQSYFLNWCLLQTATCHLQYNDNNNTTDPKEARAAVEEALSNSNKN